MGFGGVGWCNSTGGLGVLISSIGCMVLGGHVVQSDAGVRIGIGIGWGGAGGGKETKP